MAACSDSLAWRKSFRIDSIPVFLQFSSDSVNCLDTTTYAHNTTGMYQETPKVYWKPPFTLEITHGKSVKLGNCYHGCRETVRSNRKLGPEVFEALRKVWIIGAGQEFRLVQETTEVISQPALDNQTHLPRADIARHDFTIYVYVFETRTDSSD